MDTVRTFLPKIRTLFPISKRAVKASPSYAPVSVAKYASVFLNMPKYT